MSVFAGPEITDSGLTLCLDAANPVSYPGTGTTWRDVSGQNNNGTLIGGPAFNSANSGYLTFTGLV
jgi:hypothetical protein